MTTLQSADLSKKDTHVPVPLDQESKSPKQPVEGGPILKAYTGLHVIISLVGIAAGLVTLAGMVTGKYLVLWTSVFLWTTIATNVTGFFFPFKGFKPSYVVGALSLVFLWLAYHGLYEAHLAGAWRWTYVVTAVLSLYLNVFVLIVESFQKIPALHALAPKQNEPIFKRVQLITLATFVILGTLAVSQFHP